MIEIRKTIILRPRRRLSSRARIGAFSTRSNASSRRGRAGRCGVFPRAEEPIAKADTRSHPRLRNRWFADSPQEGYALQTLTENPYGAWREYDAEDTLRFYALRLHELGMIMSTECERG